jgi:alpha-tubulin suppressor-like RCC1 family protein
MRNQDPFTLTVTEKQFLDCINAAKFTKNRNKIDELSRRIQEHRSSRSGQGASGKMHGLTLGDIEDFALGFLQHNVKLFLFG